MSPERCPERSFCFVIILNERLEAALDERYTLERELGRLGMATKYRGRDVRLDAPVCEVVR